MNFPNNFHESMHVESPSYFTAKTNVNENQKEELGIIDLKLFSQLITTSATTQLSPLPQPSKNLRGEKIRMYDLYMSHRKFPITPEEKFKDQQTLIQ